MADRNKSAAATAQQQAFANTPYHRDALKKYFVLYPVGSIRFHAVCLVMVLLNLFILIPVLGAPFSRYYAYLLLPPLIAMNGWALALVLFPRKLQLNYVLFRGVFGIMAVLSFTAANQKFAYGMAGVEGPWYLIVSFAAAFVGFYFYARHTLSKLKQPPKIRKDRSTGKGPASVSAIVSAFAGFGYLAANMSLAFANQAMVAIVLMSVYTLLTFVLFHFIMDLHRYCGLKRMASNRELV